MRARQGRPDPGTALYVHLPFCVVKCPYCDFFSVEAEGQDHAAVVHAILEEARHLAPQHPSTLFLGGGTPSLLSTDLLEELLDGLHALTGFRDSAVEVTAECNPESLDLEKASCLAALQVRRLSIGFQSLDPGRLEFFGRAHTQEQALGAYEAARQAGVEAINIDLIYSGNGQTPEEWGAELERVLSLGPDHLSAYNLTFEEGTPFHTWLRQGRIERAPEDVELECFALTRELAGARGLQPYEISNFSRPGAECLHNLAYWANVPYVGLGPGAVSKVGQTRFGNPRSISRYLRDVNTHGNASEWSETLEPEARLGETWWLGLRRKVGVCPREARSTAGYEGQGDPALSTARRLGARGLLEESGGRWILTESGLPLADAIAREFLD